MTFNFKNFVEKFPLRVMEANELNDLPTERQNKLSARLYEMLFESCKDALMSHLNEKNFSEINAELEADESLDKSDILALLAERIPHSNIILEFEMKNLFRSLTPNT
jgi:hypothetical protein